jgi:hypothetical protein
LKIEEVSYPDSFVDEFVDTEIVEAPGVWVEEALCRLEAARV